MNNVIIKNRYRCIETKCKCGKTRFIRLSRIKTDRGLCRSCLVSERNLNKGNEDKYCKICGILLNNQNRAIFGKEKQSKLLLCKEHFKQQEREKRFELKKKIINHFGGKCSCCGETKIEFLTIDHINNDGYLHRNGNKKFSGDKFYKDLLKNNYNSEYELQILCWNCNCSKGAYGYCPHN